MVEDSVDTRLREVEMGLNTHEAVCVERYNNILGTHQQIKKSMDDSNERIEDRIDKSDSLLKKVAIGLLAGMAAILAHQIFH